MQPAETIGPEDADGAETSRLSEAIGTLLPSLERFNRYEGAGNYPGPHLGPFVLPPLDAATAR